MKITTSKFLGMIFMLGMLFNACNGQTELEGKWVGCDVRKPLMDWTLTIQGDRFYLIREDVGMWYSGLFKLNNNCALKKIDLEIRDTHQTANNGKILLGIYDVDGESLTFITNKPGNHSRPLSFDETAETVVFNFVRS
jgi:uncharacterized protein (TIGR03067 family)